MCSAGLPSTISCAGATSSLISTPATGRSPTDERIWPSCAASRKCCDLYYIAAVLEPAQARRRRH
eukprot:3675624-Pyramimonas_sp.AAC.1